MIWFYNYPKKSDVYLIVGPFPPPWHAISVTHFTIRGSWCPPLSIATYGSRRVIHSKSNEIKKAPHPKFLRLVILTLISCPFILETTTSLQWNMVGCKHFTLVFISTFVSECKAALPHNHVTMNPIAFKGSWAMVLMSFLPSLRASPRVQCCRK